MERLDDGEEDEDASSGGPGSPPDISFDDELDADSPFTIPNQLFQPARILVNPRCVTTYAGVSHTDLAVDLFGPPDREEEREVGREDVLDEWEGAPDTFVCQEQRSVPVLFSVLWAAGVLTVDACRTTGGRRAAKTQRRISFSIHRELEESFA